jgi:hypothetical protein
MSGFDESEQELRSSKKPDPLVEGLAAFLKEHWGISVDMASLKKIDSYDDANFYLAGTGGAEDSGERRSFLLKYYNAVGSA